MRALQAKVADRLPARVSPAAVTMTTLPLVNDAVSTMMSASVLQQHRRTLSRPRVVSQLTACSVPAEEVAELWSTFESAAGQATPSQSLLDRNRIQIKRIVQFAGECYECVDMSALMPLPTWYREDVEVWNDSEEAQAYLARPPRPLDAPAPTAPAAAPADKPIDRSTANYGQGYERRQAEPAGTTSSSGPIKRPRKSLASMAASITGKPTKINSLEKSKMDWNRCACPDPARPISEVQRPQLCGAQQSYGGPGRGPQGQLHRTTGLSGAYASPYSSVWAPVGGAVAVAMHSAHPFVYHPLCTA
jgi:hypothetical protein